METHRKKFDFPREIGMFYKILDVLQIMYEVFWEGVVFFCEML